MTTSYIQKQGLSIAKSLLQLLAALLDQLVVPLLAVVIALITGAVLMLAIGINPIDAYGALWQGIAGGFYQVGLVLTKATPLIITGLGVGFAFRSGMFNIGAEGQIYMGALAGTAVGIQDWGLPLAVHLSLALLAAFLAGGLWAGLAGFLKGRYQVNEIITTILLNYIAIFTVSYFTHGPLQEDKESVSALPHTAEVLWSSKLPIVWEGTRLHAGFILAIFLTFVTYFILFHTSFGYKARAVGYSQPAARYAGMSVVSIVILAMIISGGLAGVAGAGEIFGVSRRLRDVFVFGTGYTAIAIALLGKNHPFGIFLAGIFFGAIEVGASTMESLAGVPSAIVGIIQAVIIFLVAVGVVIRSDTFSHLLSTKIVEEKQ